MLRHFFYLIKLLFLNKKKFYFFLYKLTGFIPTKTYLFELAFIHKSASVEFEGILINNERLEFLGDSILDAVIAEYLFKKFPDKNEGFLTKLKSKIVNRENLNSIALILNIDQYVIAQTNNIHYIKYINGNALEALIGAIFLDKGYNRTKKFIISRIVDKHLQLEDLANTDNDFKSLLLEWSQKNRYDLIFDTSEDFESSDSIPAFISNVTVNNEIIGKGKGKSKKEAEQNASKEALSFVKLNNKHK